MKHHSGKLEQRQQQQAQQHSPSASETQVLEFASADEVLRYDATQTQVPPGVAERLRESIHREPRPAGPSWWKRWFGR